MKKVFLILLTAATYVATLIAINSCTENERVKSFGGQGNLEIPMNEKFVNVTWKENEIWVITKRRSSVDTEYNTYYFREHSSYGIVEGTYKITETQKP